MGGQEVPKGFRHLQKVPLSPASSWCFSVPGPTPLPEPEKNPGVRVRAPVQAPGTLPPASWERPQVSRVPGPLHTPCSTPLDTAPLPQQASAALGSGDSLARGTQGSQVGFHPPPSLLSALGGKVGLLQPCPSPHPTPATVTGNWDRPQVSSVQVRLHRAGARHPAPCSHSPVPEGTQVSKRL